MIQFDHVDYSYHQKQPVLKDINISIQRGEKIGVLGESGAGKSTIGSLILGQLKPTKGKISIDSGKVLPIFQHATESFDRQFTIEQSLREPLLFYRQLIPQNIKNIILNYLIEFNLSTDLITKFPQEVSGGQLQRLNIIRSLLAQPDILVCDEITSNLDVMAEQNVINILLNEKNIQNKTLIVISHDLSVLQRLTNRIIVIKDGQIVDDFKSKDLFSHQRHPYTKLLIQTYEY
ncbi:ABC transporter ATP-binding protein [Staphylococcus epidermidis]|uniref:ABC transporter ATP-binding protein n=1 Tax=Staphylococcus epidermidis TaxID=1282 RepID=UPI001887599F|nr:dipeptide/oligopeptide/nickel ABC transporter ATP-binding protein [Staphylococcus epidermidis]MBF2170959.1 ABC transporter ATP-binding protein [Staphylococcus epidermidis]